MGRNKNTGVRKRAGGGKRVGEGRYLLGSTVPLSLAVSCTPSALRAMESPRSVLRSCRVLVTGSSEGCGVCSQCGRCRC